LGIFPFIKLLVGRKIISLIFPTAAFFSLQNSSASAISKDVNLLYASEGLLGQIIVADYPLYEGQKKINGSQRILFVNRSTQTVVTSKEGEKDFFEYANMIAARTKGSSGLKILLLGLGGGSVANKLLENGHEVTAVELDTRMEYCARKYFDLSPKVNVIIDDARHFIRKHKVDNGKKEKYDAIVLDAFVGEVNPNHLFTTEFFLEIKTLLADSGQFFINGNGFWNGKAGRGMRSIGKTLLASGFNVEVVPTDEEEDYRNLLFIAKKSIAGSPALILMNRLKGTVENDLVLTDDKPQLELLNAEANRNWREACMKYFLSAYYSKQDMLLYK
ncbi:MAG TPA: fused MFS/spermidine synthase, partial [Bacteroidia bacterium]